MNEGVDEIELQINENGKLTLDSETSLLKGIQRAETRIKNRYKAEKAFRDFLNSTCNT